MIRQGKTVSQTATFWVKVNTLKHLLHQKMDHGCLSIESL